MWQGRRQASILGCGDKDEDGRARKSKVEKTDRNHTRGTERACPSEPQTLMPVDRKKAANSTAALQDGGSPRRSALLCGVQLLLRRSLAMLCWIPFEATRIKGVEE